MLYGGVYINKNEKITPYESGISFAPNKPSDAFHIYSVIWRTNIIIFLVDNVAYGWITNKKVLQTFDKEVCYNLQLRKQTIKIYKSI